MRVANCEVPIAANTPDASLTFGALEVINVAAARAYQLTMDECELNIPLDHGEDHFLHECAADWEVFTEAANEGGIVMDPACSTSFKAGCGLDSVSFHPYRTLEEFEVCHTESLEVTKQQKKDADPYLNGGGGRDEAHAGGYAREPERPARGDARFVTVLEGTTIHSMHRRRMHWQRKCFAGRAAKVTP